MISLTVIGGYWFGLGYTLGSFVVYKKFRDLVDTGGVHHKGIFIQWKHPKCGFSSIRPVMIDNKRGCNMRFCTHTEALLHKEIWSELSTRDKVTQTTSLTNPPKYNYPRDPYGAISLLHTPILTKHHIIFIPNYCEKQQLNFKWIYCSLYHNIKL